MSKSTKKLISQRWEETFSEKVKKIASTLNMTTTDLTIESLEFIVRLVEEKPKIMKDPKKRKEYLQYICENIQLFSDKLTANKETKQKVRKRHKGYIIDRITDYLKENAGKTFSSTGLSEVLDIPQPTVRAYIRNLAEKDEKYQIIKGRPNFVGYKS